MEHYICMGGCGGVSNEPTHCQAHDCPNFREALKPCDCSDTDHYGVLEKPDEDSWEDQIEEE